MVVRLGQTSNVTLLNSQRYRILQGQALQLQYASDVVATVRAWARVRYDNGEDSLLFIPDAVLVSDRVPALCPPSDVARYDGWVTDALVELGTDSVKRGQVYIRLFLDPFGTVLCADYVHSTFGQVCLGTYIQPGPGGGGGNLQIVTVKAEAVPVASTVYTFAASNTIRKILGYVHYYIASGDAATRTIDSLIRNPLGARPTGLGGMAIWESSDLVLTLSQGGASFSDSISSGTNDNGTVVISDVTTAPSPFPILVQEGDLSDMQFAVANLHANDLDTIYVLMEEWVML